MPPGTRESGGEPMNIESLQFMHGMWADQTFRDQTSEAILEHLKREVKELQESGSPEEAADCLLLLLSYAHKCGFDLMEQAIRKHRICRQRQWGSPDEL